MKQSPEMYLYKAIVRRAKNGDRRDRTGHRIEFKLSFDDWYQIWLDSGKFHLRGGKKSTDYVMSRYNDLGDYEVGNVFIQTLGENSSQGNLTRTKEQYAAICAKTAAKYSFEARSRNSIAASKAMGVKKNSERAKKIVKALGKEGCHARSLKAWETRRTRAAERANA